MIRNNEDFKDVYEKYLRFSVSIAYQITRNRALAEDISQEVFYRLYCMGCDVDLSNEKALRSYIFTTTVNRVRDHYRRAYVKRETGMDSVGEHLDADTAAGPEELVLRMEKSRYQKLVLQKLRKEDPLNYEILIKVKYLKIPPGSVAKEYGITRNNVNNRIRRTRAWLDRELKKIYP